MDPQVVFFYVVLGILGVTTLLQIFKRRFMPKLASRIFLYSSGIVFAYLIYIGYLQFEAFRSGVLGFTIGSGEGLRWFFSYTQLHYWNTYLVSLPAAILFILISLYFNRKYGKRFFEDEELYIMATGILLTGYPAFIFYIPAVLLISAIASAIFVKRGERIPLYYFWMPVAIAAHLAFGFVVPLQNFATLFKF